MLSKKEEGASKRRYTFTSLSPEKRIWPRIDPLNKDAQVEKKKGKKKENAASRRRRSRHYSPFKTSSIGRGKGGDFVARLSLREKRNPMSLNVREGTTWGDNAAA